MSDLEEKFMDQLIDAGLHTSTTGLVRELRFARSVGRQWRLDFAFTEHSVAVEVDGGSWVGGRHTRGVGFDADCQKLSTAAAMGWRVLRVNARMIKDGSALILTKQALEYDPEKTWPEIGPVS